MDKAQPITNINNKAAKKARKNLFWKTSKKVASS